jgi:hypothetical protein
VLHVPIQVSLCVLPCEGRLVYAYAAVHFVHTRSVRTLRVLGFDCRRGFRRWACSEVWVDHCRLIFIVHSDGIIHLRQCEISTSLKVGEGCRVVHLPRVLFRYGMVVRVGSKSLSYWQRCCVGMLCCLVYGRRPVICHEVFRWQGGEAVSRCGRATANFVQVYKLVVVVWTV